MLESGETGNRRTEAYRQRAIAYDNKGEHDLAQADRKAAGIGSPTAAQPPREASGSDWLKDQGEKNQSRAAIIASRAKLDEVAHSGQPAEREAELACGNLFGNTFARNGDVWATRVQSSQNPFAPSLTPAPGATNLEFGGVMLIKDKPADLSDADRLNGLQFVERLELQASSVRQGGGDWQNISRPDVYKGLGDNNWQPKPQPVVVCTFSVRNNQLDVSVDPDVSAWENP